MCSTIPRSAESNLHDPSFGRSLLRVIEQGFLVETKEDFLHYILGLTPVIHNAQRNREHQPRISYKEQVQGLGIFTLETSHKFFIAGGPNLNRLWRYE